MKTKFTFASLTLVILLFFSCKKTKDDVSKPVISLKGDANMVVSKGVTISDPGATAMDDTDGDISSQITSDWAEKVKFNETGTYNVTYSVSDKKGNSTTATRVVTVKNNSGSLLGNWDSQYASNSGMTSVFASTISAGDNANQIVVYPFRAGQIYMKMNISGIFGTELSYSQSDWNTTSTGTGTITNSGRTIILTFTTTSSIGDFAQTGTLTLK